jgi:hypothetical protein
VIIPYMPSRGNIGQDSVDHELLPLDHSPVA